MPSGQGAGTNPIHNKQKKKKAVELDEDDVAYKAKLAAGAYPPYPTTGSVERHRLRKKKQREELAKTVGKGKGPLNTGSQGIKKSGKK
ncbi:uncharacterized protein ALTATR162_LOCUS4743 [Alternaria atra]|uniref:Uncharacterized protein n=1 Tax=Alternaria atra TaxID=119953 RepID=A0A8J2I6G4_9PLEO|nr:uncharacterized protein ALTATR162_LOCUS4743 [Alternaria atra]CAG5156950.1 unnamed protein product [Alternaria atra]